MLRECFHFESIHRNRFIQHRKSPADNFCGLMFQLLHSESCEYNQPNQENMDNYDPDCHARRPSFRALLPTAPIGSPVNCLMSTIPASHWPASMDFHHLERWMILDSNPKYDNPVWKSLEAMPEAHRCSSWWFCWASFWIRVKICFLLVRFLLLTSVRTEGGGHARENRLWTEVLDAMSGLANLTFWSQMAAC